MDEGGAAYAEYVGRMNQLNQGAACVELKFNPGYESWVFKRVAGV